MGRVSFAYRCCLDCGSVVKADIDEMGQKKENVFCGLFGVSQY